MKVLIAEDDVLFRRILEHLLAPEFEVCIAEDGEVAWAMLQQNDGPMLAVLDWVMPGMTGPQICQEARANPRTAGAYMILLTAKNSTADIVAGLRCGADDYVTKPFEPEELQARVRIGQRILGLQTDLAAQKAALEDALAREKSLQTGLSLPLSVSMSCETNQALEAGQKRFARSQTASGTENSGAVFHR
jgi:DNA-binding response OmpR family regulator